MDDDAPAMLGKIYNLTNAQPSKGASNAKKKVARDSRFVKEGQVNQPYRTT